MRSPTDRTWLKGFPVIRGVHLLESPSAFEQIYGALRKSEGRLLSDAQVRQLPDGSDLPFASEWHVRRNSTDRLLEALHRHTAEGRILEVGCGNGWLSARMRSAGHQVIGIDPFTAELEQAARVFRDGSLFARASPFTAALPKGHFDAVVFAASIQYFADARSVLLRALDLVRPGGQVHVLDTVLYDGPGAAERAVARSNDHFTRTGHPAMIGRYHAHQRSTLLALPGARLLASPTRFPRLYKLMGKAPTPFTHLVLTRG